SSGRSSARGRASLQRNRAFPRRIGRGGDKIAAGHGRAGPTSMETRTDGSAVHVRGLKKHFGRIAAVDGLDLDVHRGEALGLLGPNGAGKTRTLRILATLSGRDAGEVSVLGLDPARDGAALRARIGVVPQEIALYGDLTARENLVFFARVYGVAAGRIPD